MCIISIYNMYLYKLIVVILVKLNSVPKMGLPGSFADNYVDFPPLSND